MQQMPQQTPGFQPMAPSMASQNSPPYAQMATQPKPAMYKQPTPQEPTQQFQPRQVVKSPFRQASNTEALNKEPLYP